MQIELRIGMGYDVHRLVSGRPLILGGVTLDHSHGLLGHSDADVLTHAVMDALLGAAGLGDIGCHFPDSDARYRGISSLRLLERVAGMLKTEGLRLVNLDVTLVAQAPRIAPHTSAMQHNLAQALEVAPDRINIKATTTEKLGFIGLQQGMAAHCIALIQTDA